MDGILEMFNELSGYERYDAALEKWGAHRREIQREYQRDLYRERRLLRRCGQCGRPSAASICEDCRPGRNEKRRRLRTARRAQGLCIVCRSQKETCACNERRRKQYATNRAAINEQKRKWAAKNRLKLNERRRKGRAAKRDAYNDRQRRYRVAIALKTALKNVEA